MPTTVFVPIRAGRHAADWVAPFRAPIADLPEIVEAHRLTGNFDDVPKRVPPQVGQYDAVYKRPTRRPELFAVAAYISMETLKLETSVPTDYAP